jgi:hypothetical protein
MALNLQCTNADSQLALTATTVGVWNSASAVVGIEWR